MENLCHKVDYLVGPFVETVPVREHALVFIDAANCYHRANCVVFPQTPANSTLRNVRFVGFSPAKFASLKNYLLEVVQTYSLRLFIKKQRALNVGGDFLCVLSGRGCWC